jgi:hypothetical protein
VVAPQPSEHAPGGGEGPDVPSRQDEGPADRPNTAAVALRASLPAGPLTCLHARTLPMRERQPPAAACTVSHFSTASARVGEPGGSSPRDGTSRPPEKAHASSAANNASYVRRYSAPRSKSSRWSSHRSSPDRTQSTHALSTRSTRSPAASSRAASRIGPIRLKRSRSARARTISMAWSQVSYGWSSCPHCSQATHRAESASSCGR